MLRNFFGSIKSQRISGTLLKNPDGVMILFSVIIPTFNRQSYIGKTLESALDQSFKDYEIIVVDDGSEDRTLDIVKKYPVKKIFQQSNSGPGAARNLGTKHAEGKYLAFLDSDDLWFPWTLETFHQAIILHHEPALVNAKLREFSDDKDLSKINQEPLLLDAYENYYQASFHPYFMGGSMIVMRKDNFLSSGGFNEKKMYAEDCDLVMRCGLAKGFVQILAPVTLGYRKHQTNASRNHDMVLKGSLNLVTSEKHSMYPGGKVYLPHRARFLTLHLRPRCIECIKHREWKVAFQLYRRSLIWNIYGKRWRFIFGFPLFSLMWFFGIKLRSQRSHQLSQR
jgi:glycosyltransferase involved in cell wall biosynthesis